MSAETERVPLDEVRDLIVIGEPLPFRVLDALGRLLLAESHVISSERQYESLLDRGAWAEREAVEAVRLERGLQKPEPAGHEKAVRQKSIFDAWEQMTWDLDSVLRRAFKGDRLGTDLDALVTELTRLVDRDPDIALFEAVRQDDHRFALYPQRHALHCATVVWLVSRRHAPVTAQGLTLVKAALSMNVAILDLQAHMAEQLEPPSRKQLETLRAHPDQSARILTQVGVSDAAVLKLIRDHHEHVQGGGYPSGEPVKAEPSRLLRMADVYMAKISQRAFRPGLPPALAAAQLYKQEAGGPLASAFVHTVGLHPPGAFVTLATGEVGVVKRRPASAGPSPVVATLSDSQGRPSVQTHERDTADPAYAIKGPATEGVATQRVLPERIYGMQTL